MTRRLIVMRHAKAEDGSGLADADRALTGRGRRQATAAGQALARAGLLPDHVLCSPARRTRQTLELVLAELPGEPTVDMAESLYGAGPDEALRLVSEVPDTTGTLLVVGHNPTMARLAAAFPPPGDDSPSGLTSFPTASVAVVDLEVEWLYVAPGTGTARVL